MKIFLSILSAVFLFTLTIVYNYIHSIKEEYEEKLNNANELIEKELHYDPILPDLQSIHKKLKRTDQLMAVLIIIFIIFFALSI